MQIQTLAPDRPLRERLAFSLAYPLRGAALASCVGLALMHYVALLPSYVGMLGAIVVWAATWRYAAECLLHTAHGYASSPDIGLGDSDAAGWALTAVHLMAAALFVLCAQFYPAARWPLLALLAFALPAIDMSLAFDANLAVALNPRNLLRIVAGFSGSYLWPVVNNVLLAALIVLSSLLSGKLPLLLALPLFAFAYSYLIVLGFHWMGAMIHQRHEAFGLQLDSDQLVAANGQDSDRQLLDEAQACAMSDPPAALRLLAERLHDRAAPAAVHLAYRQLLRQQGLQDDLLIHGQIWIAVLMAGDEPRRALGLVQECTEIDPRFLPDAPQNLAQLAELAARLGMRQMALRLSRGFLSHWPRDAMAPRIGLLAASLLHETPAEAGVLLSKLAAAWPDHPLRGDMDAKLQQLDYRPHL